MAPRQPFIIPARFFKTLFRYMVLTTILLLNVISTRPAFGELLDFGSFIAAGKQATAGENPYAAHAPLVYQVKSDSTGQPLPSPNLNPPLSVVFFAWLNDVEPLRAVNTWRILSAVLFLAGIFLLGWHYRTFTTPLRILWAICFAGFWTTLALGQIYAPIFLVVIAAWILLEKDWALTAGIFLGILIAIKPNFFFWLLLLRIGGQLKTLLSAVGTFLALSIVPIFILGTQVYPEWITALLDYPSLGLTIAGNSSFQSLAASSGLPSVGILLSIVLATLSAYFVYRQRSSLHVNAINALGIVGSLLVSPFSWAGYTVLTLPIFFSMPRWNRAMKLSAACLIFPYVVILYFFQYSVLNRIVFGWLYGWGLLLILASFGILTRTSSIDRIQGSSI